MLLHLIFITFVVCTAGSTADGQDDDNASVLSLSSSGGERVRGNTGVPGS